MIPTRKQWQQWSLPSKYTALGLVLGIIGIAIAVFSITYIPNEKRQNGITSLSGEFFVNDLEKYEINYGARFLSKPKLSLYKVHGKYRSDAGASVIVIMQRLDGFTIDVTGLAVGGERLLWEATGQIDANK
ncbi:MAG: hypothetical protein N0E54_19130 [Candidatus Thiodiazotropha taylori]|nr:hypothetical protein [Candidatus Thiodiazotropha endolucinida]MCW4230862.1 hypothetical protein [Candidatus Thiodiazotropha taylori]